MNEQSPLSGDNAQAFGGPEFGLFRGLGVCRINRIEAENGEVHERSGRVSVARA